MARPSSVPVRRVVLFVALVLALAVHLLVLYLPASEVPSTGFEVPGLDKAVHVLVFAVPTALALLITGRGWPAAALLVHAPVSEWLQGVLAQGRSVDGWDVAADVVGVALGVWLAVLARRRCAAPQDGGSHGPSGGRGARGGV